MRQIGPYSDYIPTMFRTILCGIFFTIYIMRQIGPYSDYIPTILQSERRLAAERLRFLLQLRHSSKTRCPTNRTPTIMSFVPYCPIMPIMPFVQSIRIAIGPEGGGSRDEASGRGYVSYFLCRTHTQ